MKIYKIPEPALLHLYQNGNYDVKIYSDGTKVRTTEDDEFIAQFPENIDCKITNKCDMGCAFCHENSVVDGLHGNINHPILSTLHPGQEIACLDGETIVYTESGSKLINELKENDTIFDSDHKLRKIIKIQKSIKPCFELKTTRSLKVKCSSDHPFIKNGKIIQLKDFNIKDNIDILKECTDTNNDYPVIDLAQFIQHSTNQKGSRGGTYNKTHVRISNSCKWIPRYLTVDEDVMYLYGIFVAEGSTKGLSLHIDEYNSIFKRVEKIWAKITGGLKSKTYIKNKSLTVELQSTRIVKAVFNDALKIQKGAKNKGFDFLFQLKNKSLIQAAFEGFIDGDGCIHYRKNKKQQNLSIKTSSRKLIYDFVYLCKKWFDIELTFSKHTNPETFFKKETGFRYVAPRIAYRAETGRIKDIKKFYNSFKLQEFTELPLKTAKTNFIVKEIVNLNETRELYDITLEEGSHIFPINGYILTHNCGGGNIFEHPDFEEFLIRLKDLEVISNITVNQHHIEIEENLNKVRQWQKEKLVYGVGISYNGSVDYLKKVIKSLYIPENAVIHTIAGIHNLEPLVSKELKVLILGYKSIRRGKDFINCHGATIRKKIAELEAKIPEYLESFKVLSFDNLALEQLNIKKYVSPEDWKAHYMGDDGSFTMYIDLVKEEFAKNSTSVDRYNLNDYRSIEEIFNKIKN